METTLLIMAAGIGSRFGTGIKQLEPVLPFAGNLVLRLIMYFRILRIFRGSCRQAELSHGEQDRPCLLLKPC